MHKCLCSKDNGLATSPVGVAPHPPAVMWTVGIAFAMLCTLLLFKAIAGALLGGWGCRMCAVLIRSADHDDRLLPLLALAQTPQCCPTFARTAPAQSGGWAGR